jgi:hypothetical protein
MDFVEDSVSISRIPVQMRFALLFEKAEELITGFGIECSSADKRQSRKHERDNSLKKRT